MKVGQDGAKIAFGAWSMDSWPQCYPVSLPDCQVMSVALDSNYSWFPTHRFFDVNVDASI